MGREWSEHEKESYRIIKESGLFNEGWYIDRYKKASQDPRGALEYYIEIGQYQGENPTDWFDAAYYAETYPDVKSSGFNPFAHYVLHGKERGYLPKVPEKPGKSETVFGREWTEEEIKSYRIISESGLFDEEWYLDTYEEAREDERGALEYYIEIGQYRGDNPVKWFDTDYYLQVYPSVNERGVNPFTYYILEGKEKGHSTEKILGEITHYGNGKIKGWCYGNYDFKLLVMVGGKACSIVKSNLSKPKVAERFNLPRDDIGFVAKVNGDIRNEREISLYALLDHACQKVAFTHKYKVNNVSPRSLSGLEALKRIARLKDSVAIVVWDVTHDSIERAKVLYDIVKPKHPVMMIGFNFSFSKKDVWEPYVSSDVDMMSIKWDERELYASLIKEMKISFDTLWICEPRFPGYLLADMLSDERSKFILDMDDNESEIPQSDFDFAKPYGIFGNHMAEYFTEKIDAISSTGIPLEEFDYNEFEKLKNIASNQKKHDIFDISIAPNVFCDPKKHPKTVVLLWKQPDSTVYGRRVDQIARSYKRIFPEQRVVILEILEKEEEKYLLHDREYYISDSSIILERIREKRIGLNIDGVEHIILDNSSFANDNFRNFLLLKRILPWNSLFILFPVIPYFNKTLKAIDGYRYIADIVDNQLGWNYKYPHKIVEQYRVLTKGAVFTIFNSSANRDYFLTHGLLDTEDDSFLVPNWYELPALPDKYNKISKEQVDKKRIFYSGNMNDRIDWNLIDSLLHLIPKDITLFLIGNALKTSEALKWLLSRHDNCQFLGPMDERNLILFIKTCSFAIMPHKVEPTSKYMNPLKVHMFAALGIECISTDMPGLESESEKLVVCKDKESFLEECLSRVGDHTRDSSGDIFPEKKYLKYRDKYMQLVLKTLNQCS